MELGKWGYLVTLVSGILVVVWNMFDRENMYAVFLRSLIFVVITIWGIVQNMINDTGKVSKEERQNSSWAWGKNGKRLLLVTGLAAIVGMVSMLSDSVHLSMVFALYIVFLVPLWSVYVGHFLVFGDWGGKKVNKG